MEKLDLRKQYKHLYQPSAKEASVVDVPPLQFAMIDGAIEPGQLPGDSPAFQQAVEALYGISYTLKFMSKQRPENPVDYTVMALEGLWWEEDGHFDIANPGNWRWTAMIMATGCTASTTKSTLATRVAQIPPGSRPYCGTRLNGTSIIC